MYFHCGSSKASYSIKKCMFTMEEVQTSSQEDGQQIPLQG